MSCKELQIEYTATKETLDDMACAEYDTRPHGLLRRCCGMAAGVVLALVACISLWRLFHASFDAAPEMVRLLLCLYLIQFLVGIVLVFHRPLSLFLRRRELHSQIGKNFSFTLTDEGVGGEPLGTSLVLPWSFFKISIVKGKGVLLRYRKLCYWLPQAAMSGNAIDLLQKNNATFS